MSEYIKKINWPWVEVDDMFEEEGTVTINMNEVELIWSRINGQYHCGVKFKDGSWFEFISKDVLKELQELLINRQL